MAAILLLSACTTTVSGEPQPDVAAATGATTTTAAPTSTSSAPAKPLPFTPTIKNRTNDRTDGTTFEPCSAYTDAELLALDINPTTITDAAKIDYPNFRGCDWLGTDYTAKRGGSQYSQIVGRELTLDEYKRTMKRLPWQADRTANGRTIALAPENNYCIAAFASEKSIVTTSVIVTNPSPGRTVECDRAFAFASLAVSKAP
ncbi:DUF3558 family protein [Tsukamurella strandjordii]|uniref:DUF3558 family protein n=1 Tax=Tsukamurella strandjordii TaxID=147577 RepID=A0AA90SHA7_9ACTN|nr:DUF3558 family protein [Tsukamurella strandjordii]MDP0398619.1 DUF3558 family protein [Tsukamurella strandjordii]